MKRITYFVCTLLFINLGLEAQIQRGGSPMDYNLEAGSPEIDYLQMPDVDVEAARAEDAVTDQFKETPYRFGIEHDVELDFFDYAQGDGHIEGMDIYRMGIVCRDARTVSLTFDEFYLPNGAQLFIYNEDRSDVLGSFTHENNKESGIFPVGLVKGDRIIIEYSAPSGTEWPTLHIGQIVHGYRPILNKWVDERGPFGNSGACNISVACDQGIPWEEQIRSVALIVNGGNSVCSGAMVNNVNFDQTPYFLTANHCLGNPNSWVYYFNHESATCTGNNGPTNQSISGGTLLASNGGSDFALIELSETPPSEYEVFYSGWDRSDLENVTSAVGIHHPAGDLKKICFENDGPYHDTNGGAQVWWIDEWEEGVTEGGSSGSPLFDQNGRIIGQLFGGAAACAGTVNNGSFDYYGRLGVSWQNGSNNNSLQPWLDPSNSGVTAIDGYGPFDVTYANDAGVLSISGVESDFCGPTSFQPTFDFRNNGSETITSATIEYSYNGTAQTSIDWTGNLAPDEIVSVELVTMNTISGENTIEIEVLNPNGVADENTVNNSTTTSFDAAPSGEESLELIVGTDGWGYETYWEIRDPNDVVIANGGNLEVGLGNIGTNNANPGAGIADQGYANNVNINEEISLNMDGCYEFHITDFYGDGITGGGNGYQLRDADGTTLAQGSDFGSEAIHIFEMVGALSISEQRLDLGLTIFPNPANDQISIQGRLSEVLGMRVFDMVGRTVMNEPMTESTMHSMDISALPAGVYHIEFMTAAGRDIQRFVKR